MGGALNKAALVAFTDELEQIKEAGAPEWLMRAGSALKSRFSPRGILKTMHGLGAAAKETAWGPSQISLGQRMSNIPQGLKAGWEEFGHIPGLTRKVQDMPVSAGNIEQALVGATAKKPETFKDIADFVARATPEQKKSLLGGAIPFVPHGEHLLNPSQTLRGAWSSGGLKGAAEELSRRGITGGTRATKYLPVGQKVVLPAFSAAAIPEIVNAPKSTPTGEGGAVERGLGEVAGLGGMVMTGGMGLMPAMGGWYLANKAGGRIGRVIDRVRAGGSMDQAINAPSPEQAQQQLARIQKHYG